MTDEQIKGVGLLFVIIVGHAVIYRGIIKLTEENETLEKKVKNLEVNLKEMFIQRYQYLDEIRHLKKKLSALRKKTK